MARVAAGSDFTCAASATGTLMCWGTIAGQTSALPIVVPHTGGITKLVANAQTACLITSAGAAKCWGFNSAGQLGVDSAAIPNSQTPVQVEGLASGVVDIAAGHEHTCAVTAAGAVLCWGSNAGGKLGVGNTPSRSSTPLTVISTGATAVAAGVRHTCAVVAGGLKCWGNPFGNTPSTHPDFTSGVKALAISGNETCAQLSSGVVKCFVVSSPRTLSTLASSAAKVSLPNSDLYEPCVLTGAGEALCGSPTLFPVSGLTTGVVDVTTGSRHHCAVLGSGGVRCWGDGFLGSGDFSMSDVPIDVLQP